MRNVIIHYMRYMEKYSERSDNIIIALGRIKDIEDRGWGSVQEVTTVEGDVLMDYSQLVAWYASNTLPDDLDLRA